MKLTFYKQSGLTLVYFYFFSKAQCIELNNGGESDLTCELLFDSEDEWIGLSFASNNIIEDNFEPNNLVTIYHSEGVWTILFRSNKVVARKEIQGCITDLYNNKYTGIELILLERTIPKFTYISDLIYNK